MNTTSNTTNEVFNVFEKLNPADLLISALIAIAFFLCAIGLYKFMKGVLTRSWYEVIFGGLGTIISLIILFMLFPIIGDTLSSISTIALALFAGAALYVSWKQREDFINRDETEKRIKILDRVVDWAISMNSAPLRTAISTDSEVSLTSAKYLSDAVFDSCRLISEGVYIEALVKKVFSEELGDEFAELFEKVKNVTYIMSKINPRTKADLPEMVRKVAPDDSGYFDTIDEDLNDIVKMDIHIEEKNEKMNEYIGNADKQMDTSYHAFLRKIADIRIELK